jgi:hypothetical protein
MLCDTFQFRSGLMLFCVIKGKIIICVWFRIWELPNFTFMWTRIVTCMWPCIVTNFLIIKPTRCTNFSNIFLEMKLHMFRTVPLSIIRSHSRFSLECGMSYRQLSSSRLRCLRAVYKPVWHIPLLSVQWITPDDGQRNCPKHAVSFPK